MKYSFLFVFLYVSRNDMFLNKLPKHTAREFWILKQKNKENEGLRGFFECESFDGRLHWCGWVRVLFSLSWTLSNFKTLFAESSAANSVSTKSWKDYLENSPAPTRPKFDPVYWIRPLSARDLPNEIKVFTVESNSKLIYISWWFKTQIDVQKFSSLPLSIPPIITFSFEANSTWIPFRNQSWT